MSSLLYAVYVLDMLLDFDKILTTVMEKINKQTNEPSTS